MRPPVCPSQLSWPAARGTSKKKSAAAPRAGWKTAESISAREPPAIRVSPGLPRYLPRIMLIRRTDSKGCPKEFPALPTGLLIHRHVPRVKHADQLQSPVMFYRSDNRSPDQLRTVTITPEFITTAEGSALIEVGHTRVICTASIEETVP